MSFVRHSENLDELASALVAAQSAFVNVPKRATNPFFKSKYAVMDDLKAMADPILHTNGLVVVQTPSTVADLPALTTILLHSSGQFLSDIMFLCEAKHDPQGQGAAITYARRYAYSAILGLVTDDDDDGEAAMGRTPSSSTKWQTEDASAGVPPETPTTKAPARGPSKTAVRNREKSIAFAEASKALDEAERMIENKPTAAMNNMFWALFRGTGEADAHTYVSAIVNRPVPSITQLTHSEMNAIIAIMKARRDDKHPADVE